MQTLDKFNSNLGTAILLCGGAGAGKTALGMRLFPKTWVYVADLNFESGKRYLQQIGQTANVVGFDLASPDESGKVIVPNARYDRMLRVIDEAIKSPLVETIFLDSATFIEDVIKAKICGATTEAAIRLEGFTHWGNLVLCWKSLIMQLRQSGKRIIMSSHETKEKDESDGVFRYQIAVDGSIRGKFPALFSDVWRCEVAENNNTHKWMVRTLGNARQEHLKNTYSLPGILSADELVLKVRSTLSGQTAPTPPVAPANNK